MALHRRQRNTMPIKAVGFDWDETLFEIDRGKDFYINSAKYACKKGFEAVGLPADSVAKIKEPIERFVATAHGAVEQKQLMDEAMAILHVEPAKKEAFTKAFKVYYPQYRVSSDFTGKAHLIPGAKETLQFLQKRHIPFFIASNFDQETLRIQVRQALGDMISEKDIQERVLGHIEGQNPKPAPDILQRGFAALGVKPDKHSTFFVGNSVISDMPAAIRCGTMPILFTDKEKAAKASGQEEVEVRNFGLEEPLNSMIRRDSFDITKIQITDKEGSHMHMVPMAHDHVGLKEIFMRYIADFRDPAGQGQVRA